MESLNLNTLASSLPTAQQNAEKELLNNFKAAALSITTLYRSSRQNSKRAYNAGYAAACQDLLTMIQQGLSLCPSSSSPGADEGSMTIGRVMDWTEARLEAIKSREEEEDEEEEREKEKERSRTPGVSAATGSRPEAKATVPLESDSKSNPASLPIPDVPSMQHNSQLPYTRPTPSPALTNGIRSNQRPTTRVRQTAKVDPSSHDGSSALPSIGLVTDGLVPNSYPDLSVPVTVGSKRRHGLMMMLETTPPVSISSASTSFVPSPSTGIIGSGSHYGPGTPIPPRRRTRSSKSQTAALHPNQNQFHIASEAMDVEEDGGRERKRVARR